MIELYNRYASKHYRNRPYKAFMLVVALVFGWLLSYLAGQVYAFAGAVIVMMVATKHILEYIELTYQQRDPSDVNQEKN